MGKIRLEIFALSLFLSAVSAAEDIRFNLAPESRLWLEGDSTLHPYSSTATVIEASVIVKDGKIDAFDVTIPVEGLKSKEKRLDKNMYKALKAPDFPLISFRLVPGETARFRPDQPAFPILAEGKLTVAGKENPVSIEATGASLPQGVRIQGSKRLLMTDYGVKPPTMLGVIKTRNEVTIRFDLVLVPKTNEKRRATADPPSRREFR